MLAILIMTLMFTIVMIIVTMCQSGVESHNLGNAHDFMQHPEDYGVEYIELYTNYWQVDSLGRLYKNGVRFKPRKIK